MEKTVRILSLALAIHGASGFPTVGGFNGSASAQTPGLIGHWHFDEGSGTAASDSSGNGNTGTLVNGPVWTSGKIGGALSFDGVDDVVTVPKSLLAGDITVAAWVNQSTTSGSSNQAAVIAEASSSAARLFTLLLDRVNKRICLQSINTGPCTALNSYTSAGSWTHVTLTHPANGQGAKIFINGQNITANGLTSERINGGTVVGIGRYPTVNSRNFGGLIDEVRINNRILTTQEILDLYDGGPVQDLTPPVISNVAASSITTTTAVITWTTDEPSDSQVEYGLTASYGNATSLNASPVLNHSQTLSALTPNTPYHYRVRSKDASGNPAASPNFTVTTNPLPPQAGIPNIILILADDLGWQGVGAYGQPLIQTPNIDNLAREGSLFDQAYATTLCCPSRSALLTGQHTGHTRLRFNSSIDPISGISSDNPGALLLRDVTMAEILKAANYKTALIGKWHTGSQETSGKPNFQGFDYFLGHLTQGDAGGVYFPTTLRENDAIVPVIGAPNVYVEDLYTQKSIEFITQNRDSPFFLHLAYNAPHTPLQVPSLDPYATRNWNLNQKTYAAMITRLDTNIGKIMTALSNLGIDQNTLVIFTSDNGTEMCCVDNWDVELFFHTTGPLRGYKQSLYEGGIRVPFIAYWPGTIPAGTTRNDVVALWDLLPTFAELAKVPPSRGIDGISIVPALFGTGNVSREYLYWESLGSGGLQAIRMGDWKGVRKFGPPSFELYNLAVDLGETKNIANVNPSIVNKITGLMTTGRTVGAQDGFPMPIVDPAIVCRQRELLNGVDLLSYSGTASSCAHLTAATIGEKAYTDQTAAIAALPARYLNKVLLRHANQDKNFQWSTFARLAVRQPSVVAVAYQADATVPGWLQSWTPTGEGVVVTGLAQGVATFTLYEKSFPQNATIFLGGNAHDGGNANNSYLVFVDTNTVTQAPTGLVAYWKFDEPSGPIASDSSGYDYHGILYNGPVIGNGPTRVAGKIGGGLSFNGVNDFVFAATGDTWKGDYTVSLWVKAAKTSQGGEATLFANVQNFGRGGTRDSFQIDVDGGSPGNYRLSAANLYTIAPVTIDWQFLAVTLSGTTLRTYNNGILTHTYTLLIDESNFFRNYLIGVSRVGNRGFFQGVIDEVRVYNRGLTSSEIEALFMSAK